MGESSDADRSMAAARLAHLSIAIGVLTMPEDTGELVQHIDGVSSEEERARVDQQLKALETAVRVKRLR